MDFNSGRKQQESTENQWISQSEARQTRPFKPAVIPSPIYGFKERPQTIQEEGRREIEPELEFSDTGDINKKKPIIPKEYKKWMKASI